MILLVVSVGLYEFKPMALVLLFELPNTNLSYCILSELHFTGLKKNDGNPLGVNYELKMNLLRIDTS